MVGSSTKYRNPEKSRNGRTLLAENLSVTTTRGLQMDREKIERIARLRKRARELRNNPTPSEAAFWEMVRRRKFRRRRFRRQVVIDPHIVDFCSHEIGLIVEINGQAHRRRYVADQSRRQNLERSGFYIFSFFPDEVLNEPRKVWSILTAWHDARFESS